MAFINKFFFGAFFNFNFISYILKNDLAFSSMLNMFFF
jgi:hypothetical protein